MGRLETRVHLEASATQQPYMTIEFALPVELVEDTPPLPKNWQEHQETTQAIGSRWLEAQTSLALSVPSADIPAESNYLVNAITPK